MLQFLLSIEVPHRLKLLYMLMGRFSSELHSVRLSLQLTLHCSSEELMMGRSHLSGCMTDCLERNHFQNTKIVSLIDIDVPEPC